MTFMHFFLSFTSSNPPLSQGSERRFFFDSLTCRLVDSKALGIGAASFASHAGTGTGIRGRERETGTGIRERGGDGASKDIAESPTACRNAQINS